MFVMITRNQTQQITPLIVTHVANAKLLTHLDELDPPKWLRQDVCKLPVSADVFNLCNAITDTLSDVMITCVNVLAPFMIHRVLAQL